MPDPSPNSLGWFADIKLEMDLRSDPSRSGWLPI